ncbi:hypothetical protein BCR34DRAFT_587151 [Clohesyomyces aquaticus]|uniref:Ubiquitin-like protease family profile domain-containing protein n=1 Tax=Clohesyomyces aquaticus TaxID=1231657 RepID=A0A1Y1ZQJ9_9PLEO|nr:hypothetical protein BCR34DRAFT_587151 [Clohesyomyces aquaticus]
MRDRGLFLHSDRSGLGGHVPMTKTNPPLTQRRYSIDVNTKGWHRQWYDEATSCKETEPPAIRTPRTPRLLSLTLRELGAWSWLRDNVIGVAFELISRSRECKENHIEVANPMVSQVLHSVWREHDEGVRDLAYFKTEFDRFQDKYWIFLPTNDAYGSDDATETVGKHWSLIAYNRVKGTAHYIDSMWDENDVSQAITGLHVVEGLSLLLSEEFNFQIESETPNQYLQNQCKEDIGPCGPFIIAMVDHYILAIKETNAHDDVEDQDFGIEEDFADEWYFDSRFV